MLEIVGAIIGHYQRIPPGTRYIGEETGPVPMNRIKGKEKKRYVIRL